jgi:aldehyde:ferredoxin oxidoreductase
MEVIDVDSVKMNLLEVDLTAETHRVIDVTEEVKKYLGGRGLGTKLLWDLVPPGADPLGPDNILHVGVGPLTSLIGTKTILSFKSPLTGWAGRSGISGYFGEELIKAQYNAGLLIKGKAKKPVYLYIRDDKVEIRDASDLWGKWKQETEVNLRDRLSRENNNEVFGVLCIGPAGEHLVRCANAMTESVHSASKWGCGAVMGSKNLKAIAVKGTRNPVYADHGEIWELYKAYVSSPKTALRRLDESRWGHTKSPPLLLRYAAEGIKNNHLGYHEITEQSNHFDHYLKYCVWTDGCPGCATACFIPFLKRNEKRVFGGEIRHDDVGGFNANIMIGFDETVELASLTDELGMDTEEVGGLTAWAMDLYEHGIITKEDLGGIELKWGDVEAVCNLLKKIAYKEGRAPAALAEGFRRAYEVFGEKSKWYAFEVHGCAAPTYDVRNKIGGMGLVFGTNHSGARLGEGINSALLEAATCCMFALWSFADIWGPPEEVIKTFLKPVCGWEMTTEDIKDIALRNFYFSRCFSLREGYHPAKDDYLPPRAYDEPITDKYGKTWVWDHADWEAEKAKFYVDGLRLTEKGLPPRDGLKRLGLDFVIPVLETNSAIG